jgi:hypothetical protein
MSLLLALLLSATLGADYQPDCANPQTQRKVAC